MLELEFSDDGYRIYSFLRKRWVEATPEEIVRQNYVRQLVNKRLCTLDQMAEELEVGPERDRADLIIWSEPSEKETALSQPDGPAPLIVVEVKSRSRNDKNHYDQAERYARLAGAEYFVTHSRLETLYWQVQSGRSGRRKIGQVPFPGLPAKKPSQDLPHAVRKSTSTSLPTSPTSQPRQTPISPPRPVKEPISRPTQPTPSPRRKLGRKVLTTVTCALIAAWVAVHNLNLNPPDIRPSSTIIPANDVVITPRIEPEVNQIYEISADLTTPVPNQTIDPSIQSEERNVLYPQPNRDTNPEQNISAQLRASDQVSQQPPVSDEVAQLPIPLPIAPVAVSDLIQSNPFGATDPKITQVSEQPSELETSTPPSALEETVAQPELEQSVPLSGKESSAPQPETTEPGTDPFSFFDIACRECPRPN